MQGSLILDAGCGAGRFSEIALSTGATVIAFDYSKSVNACWDNLKNNKRLHVVQADIYKLPFKDNIFNYVYSFGVLQHTPNVKQAFFSLLRKLKNNGRICVDFYRKDWKVYLWPKYWIRPIIKRIPHETLLRIVQRSVPLLLPISRFLSRVPKIGHYLKYIIPIANHELVFPLNRQQVFEWAILDTFDMFSPKYDKPQNEKIVNQWFKEAKLTQTEVFKPGLVIGRGVKSD
jgi:SAM-dependent methyltransferase